MSLPRYSEYKDSGVEWLGEVPGHWEVKPLKAIASLNDDALPETTDPDFEIEYVDIGSVSLDTGISATENFLFKNAPSRARRIVRDGDVVVSTVRTYLKAIAPVSGPPKNMIVSTGFAVIRPKPGLASGFAKYGLQNSGFVDEVIARSTGVSYPAITASDLARIAIPTPPEHEQTAIAAFLDRETAKIDGLIAEQEKLITLLAEKRQATISHAVTKGLNPAAPMKDSGVAWLGEVPAHWEYQKLRRIAEAVQTGGTPTNELPRADLEDGENWFTPGDFEGSLKLVDSAKKISNQAIQTGDVKVFPPGAVLIVSIGATLGKVGYITVHASANQQINAVVPSKKMNGYFLAYALSVKTEAMRFLSNASTIGIMNQEKTKEIWVAVPPLSEQLTISDFLDTETARLDTLTTEATHGIALLKERRAALISAAVTGKIDVRAADNQ